MILDQNTIVLNPCNGFYDEYTLVSTAQAQNPLLNTEGHDHGVNVTVPICILPGAIVGQKTVDPVYSASKYPFVTEAQFNAAFAAAIAARDDQQAPDGGAALAAFYEKYPRTHVVTPGYVGDVDSTSEDDNITAAILNAVEILILVENALIGKGINHLYFPGERVPVYSPVSGDRYLARCVPGTYNEGDPLYLTNQANDTAQGYKIRGYYFCGAGFEGTKSSEIKAYAGEDFVCPGASQPGRKPYPFYYDTVDDSTSERPATTNMNGGLVNLLRVRMA